MGMSNEKTMRLSFVKGIALAALAVSLLLGTCLSKVAYADETRAGSVKDVSVACDYLFKKDALTEFTYEKIENAAVENGGIVTTEMVVKGLAYELTQVYNEKNTSGDTYVLPDSWTL